MTTSLHESIREQVKLPVQVAFQVVMQGMRIRFGRSLVTIMGVVLGIAFLMSILTSQLLKVSVSQEQAARLEVQRMTNFLRAEIGPPSDKVVGVLQSGPLSAIEWKFVRNLANQQVKKLAWTFVDTGARVDAAELAALPGGVFEEREWDLAEIEHPSIVLLTGSGDFGNDLVQPLISRDVSIAITRNIENRTLPEHSGFLKLEQELRPEEIKKMEADKRKARFRNVWIIVISLVVTVIGITNAMLMSVTERFREIGTMKCLGALSAFIRQIFLFESCLIGAAGGIIGSLVGSVFSILVYAITYGFGIVMTSVASSAGLLLIYLALAFTAGVVLSIVAAIYPANVASRMVPSDALRSNV